MFKCNFWIFLIISTFLFFACGKGEKEAAKTEAEEEVAAEEEIPMAEEIAGYTAMKVTNGGTIKGRVTYAGAIPPKIKLKITTDEHICGLEEHYKEDLVVSQNKGLANVVVKIANINKGKSISTLGKKFVLDQVGCKFVPHIAMVPAGKELTILNSDGILHNVHTHSELNEPINVAQPGFQKEMTQVFEEPEIFMVTCDVHEWMKGYIVVMAHPYYAITDENGNFELTDAPAGTYTLEYWHETLGTATQEVTVPAGGVVEANYEFPAATASLH